jgi:hypothetical protein
VTKGLTWNEVAKEVDMTVSGVWSRYRRARPPKPPRLGRWQQVLADALDQNLAIGVRAAVADHLGRAPTRAELTATRRATYSFAALGRARCCMCRAAIQCRRPQLLGLAKPNVIMNDTRLRGLAVAGSNAAVTAAGRLVAFGLMIGGIALLGTVTATLASWLVETVAAKKEQAEDLQIKVRRLEDKIDQPAAEKKAGLE